MKLTVGATSVTIMPPDYGYSVEIHMAMKRLELSNKKYSYFDAGIANDTTILTIPTMHLNRSEAKDLSDFLLDEDTGRTNEITLDLETDRGFYPAGPHYGDTGTFTLKLLKRNISEMLQDPYLYFKHSFEFVVIPDQSYTLPVLSPEGSLQIGDVTGLRYPPEGFSVKNWYGYEAIAGFGGNVSGIDEKTNSQESHFNLICNHANASNVTDYLIRYGRSSQFTMITQTNYYAFGIENGSNDTYDVKLADNILKCTHDNFNVWNIPVKLWRI